jgi:hypothetical protein
VVVQRAVARSAALAPKLDAHLLQAFGGCAAVRLAIAREPRLEAAGAGFAQVEQAALEPPV